MIGAKSARELVCLFVLGCGWGSVSAAAPMELDAFGHKIVITTDGNREKLFVDDHQLLSHQTIDIKTKAVVAGVGVLVGEAVTGGNLCIKIPFVVSFASGQQPRLFQEDSCDSNFSYALEKDQIRFEILQNVWNYEYVWTPNDGFHYVGPKEYSVDSKGGWREFRPGLEPAPADLLDYKPIAKQINSLLGKDRHFVVGIMRGTGDGKFDGDTFIGSSCVWHFCDSMAMLVVANVTTERVFLAWKENAERPIRVRPRIQKWPRSAREAVLRWIEDNGWK